MEIKFKNRDAEDAKVVQYDMPESLEGLVEKFGEAAVAEAAAANFVISIQATARRHFDKPEAEIQEIVNGWNPNERASAVKLSPVDRAKRALAGLSDEDRAALLAKLSA